MELKDEKPFYFKTSGRAVKIWGGESISNPNIAILEMVKNAWDADATDVKVIFENLKDGKSKLIIRDNGSGMTQEEFDGKWMTAATDDKVTSPITKKFKRPKLGSKGVARFALENLSGTTTVMSKPEGESRGFTVTFDWNKYKELGSLLEKVENKSQSFQKNKEETGLEIILEPLNEKWDLEKTIGLKMDIESIIPPYAGPSRFSVEMICQDFPQIEGISLENTLLKLATFKVISELQKDGTVIHKFLSGKTVLAYLKEKKPKYTCGPLQFEYYFFYRGPSEYQEKELDKKVQEELNNFLDDWGGIKIYRDGFRVKPYGDPRNDWLELNNLRIDDPTLIPGNEQLFGFIKTNKKDNPELKDTTTREGLIENEAFKHLRDFCTESIRFFKYSRKSIEKKRQPAKAKGKTEKIQHIKRLPKAEIVTPAPKILLNFANRYPEGFYSKLESELNRAYIHRLPNATLLLARKMIENLLYNILRKRFGTEKEDVWWDEKNKRILGFGPMVQNLRSCKKDFKHDEASINKFLDLVGPFLTEANKNAHYVMEYLDNIEQIDKLKIEDMVDLLLTVRENLK